MELGKLLLLGGWKLTFRFNSSIIASTEIADNYPRAKHDFLLYLSNSFFVHNPKFWAGFYNSRDKWILQNCVQWTDGNNSFELNAVAINGN